MGGGICLLKAKFLALILISTFIILPSFADETEQNASSLSTEPTYELEATIIEGNALYDYYDTTSVRNVIYVDEKELKNKGYQSLEQALEHQPFINFVDTGFGRNIDIRGQGKDANRAVKVFLNRVPLNSLDTTSGVAAFNSVNLEDIELIEVIPGGGAVLYGSGTRGGVVNIITKKPTQDFLDFSIKGTSGEKQGLQGGTLSLSVGKAINDRLFINGSVSANYIPGPRNTGITEPYQFASTEQTNNPWITNANYHTRGWYQNCPNPPTYTDASGKTYQYFLCNTYLGAKQRGDYIGSVGANVQVQYEISPAEKVDFYANYSFSQMARPAERLDIRAYHCELNAQGKMECRNNKLVNGKFIYYYLSKDELKKDWRYTASDSIQRAKLHNFQGSINYQKKFSENWDFQALGYYQLSKILYGYYLAGAALGTRSLEGSAFNNNALGVNLKAKHDTSENTLTIGLDNAYGYANRKGEMTFDFPTYKIGDVEVPFKINNHSFMQGQKISISPYIYDSWHLTKWFDLNGGARVEYSNYLITNEQSYACSPSAFDYIDPDYPDDPPIPINVCGNATYNGTPNFSHRTERFAYALDLSPNFKYSGTGSVYVKAELGFISPSPFQLIDADPDSEINQVSNYGVISGLYANSYNDLQPERYLTAELGWQDYFSLGDFSSYVLAAFYYTHTFDEIYLNQTSGSMTYIYRNLGQTQRVGAELSATQNYSVFHLSEGVGYVWTNILKAGTQLLQNASADFIGTLEGSKVPFVPSLKASVKLEMDVLDSRKHKMSVFMNNTYTSEHNTLQSPVQVSGSRIAYAIGKANEGGYFLSDLGLNYTHEFSGSKLGVSAGVRNVFDTLYSTYAHGDVVTLGMGRVWFLEFKYGIK